MAENPYASFVGQQDPRSVIAGTAARLEWLVDRLGPDGLERATAPGKWSAREILCHLADSEVAHAFRLRQAAAEPHHVVQPWDQELWAQHYAGYDAATALRVFQTLREWNLKLIAALPGETFGKPVTHPERGQMTFRVLVETMAGHDLNHVRQMEAIERASGAGGQARGMSH